MEHIVFYSWQSDLDPALTRNFIEDALGRAVQNIGRDNDALVEPVIDRDTAGVTGAPGIAETIFQKIDSCDVFVCDVSTINTAATLRRVRDTLQRVLSPEKRATPNPNVTLELGYAAARIGWGRIILVKNTAFGGIEDLPFDLRGSPDRPISAFDQGSALIQAHSITRSSRGSLTYSLGWYAGAKLFYRENCSALVWIVAYVPGTEARKYTTYS